METRYLECNCQSCEHLLRFGWFNDEEDPKWQCLYVETQLSPYMGFFRRLWHGIKYIFGVGNLGWGETLMFVPEVKKLRIILDEYIGSVDEHGRPRCTSSWVIKKHSV